MTRPAPLLCALVALAQARLHYPQQPQRRQNEEQHDKLVDSLRHQLMRDNYDYMQPASEEDAIPRHPRAPADPPQPLNVDDQNEDYFALAPPRSPPPPREAHRELTHPPGVRRPKPDTKHQPDHPDPNPPPDYPQYSHLNFQPENYPLTENVQSRVQSHSKISHPQPELSQPHPVSFNLQSEKSRSYPDSLHSQPLDSHFQPDFVNSQPVNSKCHRGSFRSQPENSHHNSIITRHRHSEYVRSQLDSLHSQLVNSNSYPESLHSQPGNSYRHSNYLRSQPDNLHQPSRIESQVPVHTKNLLYYIDDARLGEATPGTPDADFVDEQLSTTKKYSILEMKEHGGSRRMGETRRRFVQEEGEDGVAILRLDDGPFPEFRLPAQRRQYMPGREARDSDGPPLNPYRRRVGDPQDDNDLLYIL